MKKKIFSILFALVLVLSLGLVTAVPVGAQDSVIVLSVEPTTGTSVSVGDTFSLEVWARFSVGGHSWNTADVVFQWDPTYLQLDGGAASFPGHPINTTWDDGDAAIAYGGGPFTEDECMATLDFTALASTSSTTFNVVLNATAFPSGPTTMVIEPITGADLSGTYYGAEVEIVPPSDVWVDDSWSNQDDVNVFNPALTWDTDAFDTIQEGIAAVDTGGTVNVAAGKYISAQWNEVIINKSLTLLGAQAGVDARTRSDDEDDESVIEGGPGTNSFTPVQIGADNVIFDGFKVRHPLFTDPADISGISTGGGKSNIRITNCIIHDIGTPTRTPVHFGPFAINSGPVDGLEIDHNRMYNLKHSDPTFAWANAIIVWGGASNVNIHHNKMYEIQSPASPETHWKLYDGGVFISEDCANVVIDNNEFSSNCGEYGISTNIGTGSAVTITNNVISGSTVAGIRCMDKADTITGNTISGCDAGIQVRSEATAAPTVHLNNISGNTRFGLENLTSFTVDAESNWWGDPTGPNHISNLGGTGNAVSDYVDFVPWMVGEITGKTTGMEATLPEIIAISVTPTSIDFGTLYPGNISPATTITVTNIGTVFCDVTAAPDDTTGVFQYLELGTVAPPYSYAYWSISNLQVGVKDISAHARLHVPTTYEAKGTETATLVFVAVTPP